MAASPIDPEAVARRIRSLDPDGLAAVVAAMDRAAQGTAIPALDPAGDDALARTSDATARTDAALAEHERRCATILSSLADAVLALDALGTVTLSNPAAERLLRLPAGGATGRPAAAILRPCDERGAPDPAGLAGLLAAAADGAAETPRHLLRADGSVVSVRPRVARIGAGETGAPVDRGVALVLHDRTEEARAEEGVRRAQRFEAVGALAGGVAHDVNNLVTVIQGCTQLLKERTPRDDPSFDVVEEIRRAGERSGVLARRLLAFARGQELRPAPVDLGAVLVDLRSLLGRLVGPGVELAIDPGPGVPRIVADTGALEQVVVNLAANARDAMPTGGRLDVSVRAVRDEAGAGAVELVVADTGTGIPIDVQPRIFDPFFTTKEPGKGTGLGLSIVHGIVTRSGGRIDVESEPGRGATFRLRFPAFEPTSPSAAPPRPARTALVAEDDATVRSLAGVALAAAGFRVLAARDGFEALAAAERHAGPIDLLVTDVHMPRMEGPELADRLRARRPGLLVLLVTGLGREALPGALPRDGRTAVLEKPFTPDTLAGAALRLCGEPAAER